MNSDQAREAASSPAGDDLVVPFTVDPLDLRGRVVRLGPALNAILQRHDYPAPVSRLLAEAVALTLLLGTALKFEGRFILQTRSDGPVSMLVVDFETPDKIRACARFDEQAVEAAIAKGTTTPAELLGHGHLAMTIDPGAIENRYQGVVALDGENLEEAAHRYFAQSEQIPTRVRLAVGEVLVPGAKGTERSWRAGGLMAQFLPESIERRRQPDLPGGNMPGGYALEQPDPDEAWMEAQSLVATVEDHELVDPEVTPETLLYRLFHERGVRVYDPREVIERCRCSRERIDGLLNSFTREDRHEMVVEGKIVVTCEFCNLVYTYDPADFD